MLNIAACDVHFQRLATARQHYSDAATDAQIKLADSHNADTIAQRQLDAARAALADLAPKIPKLHFTFSAARPAGLHIVRNGVDITNLTDTDLLVDLEKHHVVVTADRKQPQTFDIDVVEEGRTYAVEIAPFQAAPEPVEPVGVTTMAGGTAIGVTQTAVQPVVVSPWHRRSYLVGGLGGALLIGGVVIGLVAKSDSESSGFQAKQSAYSLGNDGTVIGVVGFVGVAAGAALWLVTRPSETTPPRAAVVPMIDAHGGGLAVTGRL